MSENSNTAAKRYEYLKIGIMAFLFLASVLLLARTIHLDNELENLNENFSEVSNRLDSLKLEFLRVEESAEAPEFLSYHDLQTLKNRGLSNPVSTLKSDLMQHPELIPYKGVLGGNMRFYREHIYILTSHWALAYFDDGHIAGYMLLNFQIGADGNIQWKVLDSYLG